MEDGGSGGQGKRERGREREREKHTMSNSSSERERGGRGQQKASKLSVWERYRSHRSWPFIGIAAYVLYSLIEGGVILELGSKNAFLHHQKVILSNNSTEHSKSKQK